MFMWHYVFSGYGLKFSPKVCVYPAIDSAFLLQFYSFLDDLYPINLSNFKQGKYNLQLQVPKMATHVFPSGTMHAGREGGGGHVLYANYNIWIHKLCA